MGPSKGKELERSLNGKPREWANVIASRTALRVAPMLTIALSRGIDQAGREIILPTFHRLAVSWVASVWSVVDSVAFAEKYYSSNDPNVANFAADAAIDASNSVVTSAEPTSFAVNAVIFATRAAGASHAEYIWNSVWRDIAALESSVLNLRPSDLAVQALWPSGIPIWVNNYWLTFKRTLVDANGDWAVWTDWYDARLKGSDKEFPNADLEISRASIAETIRSQSPRVVNAHIKRLIEESEIFQHAVANEHEVDNANDNYAPPVPTQRRAAIEPIWDKGRLTLPRKPAKLDLNKKKFTAALTALRAELRDLADGVDNEANIDKRPAAFLRQLADRIPEQVPTQDELFRLGHVEGVLLGFTKTVDDEWPDFLAARYHAFSLQFDRTIRQSSLWREFKRNAAKETLSPEQVSASPEMAKKAASALRQNEAKEFTDLAVPKSLEQLADALSAVPSNAELAPDAIEAGNELLAADLIESVNNTLKAIAEVALAAKIGAGVASRVVGSTLREAGKKYGKNYRKGFVKAASKLGTKHGDKTVKWVNRIVWGGVTGTGGFSALSNLIAKYPEAFGWLERVLQFLK